LSYLSYPNKFPLVPCENFNLIGGYQMYELEREIRLVL